MTGRMLPAPMSQQRTYDELHAQEETVREALANYVGMDALTRFYPKHRRDSEANQGDPSKLESQILVEFEDTSNLDIVFGPRLGYTEKFEG
ncbi:hypothetical protein LTS10_011994 [Elasticomyces elasticus]|nr:hypothetical protein LTS10_011994 [Elasticomyces elasticus]